MEHQKAIAITDTYAVNRESLTGLKVLYSSLASLHCCSVSFSLSKLIQ